MPKTLKKPVNFEKIIMEKVKSNEISMKPRWYFVAGSVCSVVGLASLIIGVSFLVNLSLFLLRKHGPMGQWRLQQLLVSFPWWVPMLAVGGMVLGVWMLRKYDFSYKKNFWLIVVGLIFSVILAGVVIDGLGLNDVWSRQGPMRRFYQQVEIQDGNAPLESGQGKGGAGFLGRNQ